MPKLKLLGKGTRLAGKAFNGLPFSSAAQVRLSQRLSKARSIRRLEGQSILPVDRPVNEETDLVWAGRGPLTAWPEIDWMLFRDETWQPIWDKQPMTTSMLWARWMTGRDGREDGIARTTSAPTLQDVDQHDRMEQTWARLSKAVNDAKPYTVQTAHNHQASVPAPLAVITERATSDEAIREVAFVDAGSSTEPADLCATTNKVKHKSKLWALHHRIRLALLPEERHPEQLEAYKCSWCGSWHVGYRS